ncbi:AAA family ATPase [Brachybacterium hainanense]|uniref:AAA family ATPase n=1 Tax=Brachybacterium hainanense TaxID=1541174 RepID=A0ABV6R9M8_9MICO
MSRVVMLCGPAGAGKSTLARQLEAEGCVRLSIDAEAWARGHRGMPIPPEAQAEIVADLQDRLLALIREGRDAVLDMSFWSRAMRDEWRALLAPTGTVPELVHLVAERSTALARVAARSTGHADDFPLAPALAAAYYDGFEPPEPDEGPVVVVRTG